MTERLTRAVVVAGRVFPSGTARSGDAAGRIPDGPWWSTAAAPPAPATADEPPRSGRGSGVEAWRTHAAALGVQVADDASRDDIIAAVDNR